MRKFGWKKDPEDHRDLLFHEHFKLAEGAMPPKVDHRAEMSAVEDQGELGSCTAQALVAGAEFLWRRLGEKLEGSRLWLYYQERALLGTVSEDSGANIRDGIKVLANQGLPPESMWPYDITKFTKRPNARVNTAALKRKITKYYRVTSVDTMKAALASGFTVTFGITVHDSFMEPKNGMIPVPGHNDPVAGGHAMHAVGYDDALQCFIVRNSWGTDWGLNGYCFIPYSYMAKADDMWCVEAIIK